MRSIVANIIFKSSRALHGVFRDLSSPFPGSTIRVRIARRAAAARDLCCLSLFCSCCFAGLLPDAAVISQVRYKEIEDPSTQHSRRAAIGQQSGIGFNPAAALGLSIAKGCKLVDAYIVLLDKSIKLRNNRHQLVALAGPPSSLLSSLLGEEDRRLRALL